MTQEQERTVSYQWIKGEKLGSIEEIDKEDGGFTYFKSGNRIKTDLLTEFLIESLEGEIPIQEDVEAKPDPTAGLAVSDPSDPAAGLKIAGSSPAKPKIKDTQESPVTALLKRMGDSSKDTIKVSLEMTVNIPKRSTFTVLEESFGEEVLENIKTLSLEQIDTKKVEEELKYSIQEELLKYYK